jgi:hypothetical protein
MFHFPEPFNLFFASHDFWNIFAKLRKFIRPKTLQKKPQAHHTLQKPIYTKILLMIYCDISLSSIGFDFNNGAHILFGIVIDKT